MPKIINRWLKMSLIIMLLLLSILILVHEAGHFYAARFFKMKVDKFGFGLPIGPTLFEKKFGETTVLIHAFLLGGYVSFPDDEKDCPLPPDSPERFLNKPLYQRAIVISAGVVANIICAFVLVFLTAFIWGYLPSGDYDIYIKNSPKPVSYGIMPNDKVIEVNGAKIKNAYALTNFIKMSKSNDGKADKEFVNSRLIAIEELNQALEPDEIVPPDVAVILPKFAPEEPVKLNKQVLKGIAYHKDNEIKLTAEQKNLAKLLKDKSVYVSDGNYTIRDIAYAISDSYHPVTMVVERNGELVTLPDIIVNESGLLGIQLDIKEVVTKTTTPFSIIKYSTKYLYDNTYALIYGLYQIFTGKIPLKDLHGIVAITKVGGDIIANSGIFYGILLTAVISINLAIVNFLPIPALDGGHIMFMIIEKIKGRPVSEAFMEKLSSAGFLFLILLMIIVIFNDIVGIMTNKF